MKHPAVTPRTCVVAILIVIVANPAVGGLQGEGVYYLGNGGYGEIADAGFYDLDYNKDFSVEVVIDVGVNENNNNWMGVITKTGKVGMYDKDYGGWGISVSQSRKFYSTIHAKVGDGSANGKDQIQLSSSSHYGRLHLVMTWNVTSKTLTLYINGQQVGQAINAAIDPAGMEVGDNLWLGKSLNPLASPIFYVRLWNRDLTADVAALYNNYDSTHQHQLPGGFDTTELHAEWLMFEESDAAGAVGGTHIKDTAGSNHIALLSGADLVSSAGPLAPQFPATGAIDQNKAVTLRASGGYDTLAALGTVTGPVQYYFQIDETTGFSPPTLRESGWVADFSRWQPLLKPNTTYYWRVKVQDSSGAPLTSGYTPAQSFVTEGPTNWYVRPAAGTLGNPGGTVYGSEDGATYNDAWNGLLKVVWGENGVEAGDTLYIAGLHVYNMPTQWTLISGGDVLITAPGYSEQYPITIRGDYPTDSGVVWGGYTPNFVSWTQAGTVFTTTLTGNHYLHWFFEDVTPTSHGELQELYSVADVGNTPGSFYLESDSKTLHVHMTDGTSPAGRLVANSWGYEFRLGDQQFIQFRNFEWNIPLWSCDQAAGATQRCSNLHWEGLNMAYGESMMFRLRANMHGWKIIDCDMRLAGNGIYNNDDSNDAPRDYIYRGNRIRDIGTWPTTASQDAHCVGIQGGDNGLIEDNYCTNTGSAIVLYAYTNQDLTNTTVRNNFIDGTHRNGTPGKGIELALNNDSLSDKSGNRVYGNIVKNASQCYRSNYEEQVQIFNNVGYQCDDGFNSSRNFGGNVGADVWVRNNIQSEHTRYHIFWNSGASSGFNINFDYNLYDPAGPSQDVFYKAYEGNTITFYEWQGLNDPANQVVPMPGAVFDPNSIADQDPSFANGSGTYSTAADFSPQWNSPAIDAGVGVGLTADRAGNPIYGTPDIGAFEYQPPYVMGVDAVDAGANVRVYGDGKFRNTAAPSGAAANLGASPASGFSSTDYSRFLDLSISTWETSGLYGKQWSGQTPTATTVNYTVGDLQPNTGYVLQIDGANDTALQSDTAGRVSFSYSHAIATSASFATVDASVGTDTDGDGLSDTYEQCYDGDCAGYDPYPGGDLDSTKTDTDGDGYTDAEEIRYASEPTNPGSMPSITPDGDINEDGIINVADVLLAQRYLLGITTLRQGQIDHGDLYPSGSGNGAITLSDVLLLVQSAL